jgi:hypothetical protein
LWRSVPYGEVGAAVGGYRADLVVMGTHGRTDLDRVRRPGNVTERVGRRSSVPGPATPLGASDAADALDEGSG